MPANASNAFNINRVYANCCKKKKKRGGGRGKWQFLFNAEGNGENKQLNVNVQKN